MREALITARIDHPGVVPILDAGVDVEGRAFYTMPVIKGRTLADVLTFDPHDGSLVRRVLDAVSAVAAAHEQGIVHGDLTPSNIILGQQGVTRVIDWGLARFVGEPSPPGIIGTPRYRSPEQARGEPWDRRADVFSLGAILYEVIVGEPLRAGQEPRAEVTVAQKVAHAPSELLSIVARAVANDPEQRYPDASALATDLGAWLDGRRVAAYDYSPRELLLRFLRAWRGPLIVAGVAMAVIVVMVIVGLDRLGDEVDRSERAAERAIAAESTANRALGNASKRLSDSLTSLAIVEAARGARPRAEVLAAHALAQRESPTLRGLVATWSAAPAPDIVGEWELPECVAVGIDPATRTLTCKDERSLSVWHVPEGAGALTRMWRHEAPTLAMHHHRGRLSFFEPNRDLVVLNLLSGEELYRAPASCEREVRVFDRRVVSWNAGCVNVLDTDTLETLRRFFPCLDEGTMTAVVFSDDGDAWAAVCADGTVTQGQMDMASASWRTRMPGLSDTEVPLALDLAGAGHLAIGTSEGRLLVLDRATGALDFVLRTGLPKVAQIDISPEGLAVLGSALGDVIVVDLRARAPRFRLPETDVLALAHSGDRLFVAARHLREYRVEVGPVSDIDLGGGVTSVAFSPDGALLGATTGARFEVRTMKDGVLVGRGHAGVEFLKNGAFSVDGASWLMAASSFRIGGQPERRYQDNVWAVDGWMPVGFDGTFHARRVASMGHGVVLSLPYFGGIVASHALTDDGIHVVAPQQRFADLAISFHGHFGVAVGEVDGQLVRIETGVDGPPISEVIGYSPGATAVAVSEDGALVASAGSGRICLWDAERGQLQDAWSVRDQTLVDVALSRDGRWIAAGSRQGEVFVWRLPQGDLVARFATMTDRVASVEFSPDGRWLATGSWDGHVRVFDVARLEQEPTALLMELQRSWGLALDSLARLE